ncbi:MAG: 23S rRNA (adenine(2503)-C(2))-methyltransferase RlmN [Deltaproteobacteria bacterium]|nr:23S rRNA (adenine(2503)-C(2))-methyltransferase RlmN [Deltaproteobacteria bacterium]
MDLQPSSLSFFNFTRDELSRVCDSRFGRRYIADQLFDWVYNKRVTLPLEMTNLSLELRRLLKDVFTFSVPIPELKALSKDGTIKFLFKFDEKSVVESVLMPSRNRWTLCVSSQAGCGMGCSFCKTATLGLRRNLSTAEIIGQIMHALSEVQRINNIVFMGMGEPFANYQNVKRAIFILTDKKGLNFSWRSVCVSTVGIVPKIARFFDDGVPAQLAISLNAPTQAKREQIMPVSKKFTIDQLIEQIRTSKLKKRQKIFIEYVMLKGFNTNLEDLNALVKLLDVVKHKIKINLIPFNVFDGSAFARPNNDEIHLWRDMLLKAGFSVTIRWSKGVDIQGGCGQLAGGII